MTRHLGMLEHVVERIYIELQGHVIPKHACLWDIWNQCNARVFHNKQALLHIVFYKIKKEARLWVLAGAKRLGK
jgi:hypothetical protein